MSDDRVYKPWVLYLAWITRLCHPCFSCWLAHLKQDRDVQLGDSWRCKEGDHAGYKLREGRIVWEPN